MSKRGKWVGISMAAAVAIAFVAIPYTPVLANKSELVMCPGVNSCRGKGDCMMTTDSCRYINKCKGQNACREQGFLMLTKAQCVKRGSHGIIRKLPPNAVHSQPIENTSE